MKIFIRSWLIFNKVKSWWYFLFIILGIILTQKITLASTYSENFESYVPGTIYSHENPFSPPNGIYFNTNNNLTIFNGGGNTSGYLQGGNIGNSLAYQPDQTFSSDFQSGSLSFYLPTGWHPNSSCESNCYGIYFYLKNSTFHSVSGISWDLARNNTWTFDCGNNVSPIYMSEDTLIGGGAFHVLSWEKNSELSLVWKLDGSELATSSCDFLPDSNEGGISVYTSDIEYFNLIGANNYYIDNLTMTQQSVIIILTENEITLNSPTYGQVITDFNNYGWQYRVDMLATSTNEHSNFSVIAHYGNFSIQNGIPVNPSIANESKNIGNFVKDDLATSSDGSFNQTFTIGGTSKFPGEKGIYWGNLELYGDSNLLATTSFLFSISSSTPLDKWCTNLCADIGTSTDFFGYIGNGVNCALRNAGCYLFVPQQQYIDQIWTDSDTLKTKFPASTFFDIIDTVENATASSTFSNQAFSMPFIRKTATTTQYYMIPVISSSTIINAIGANNYYLYRLFITDGAYLGTIAIIIFMIL